MHHFDYRDGVLYAEDVPLPELAARHGTPLYVYSAATLRRHYRVFDEAFADIDHLVCYSVKACSNIAVLDLLQSEGSGFDIVSGGELFRLQQIGADPSKVVFSGVGKTADEMEAALQAGILSFNIESAEELRMLESVAARLNRPAPISIRVNPDVDARTHPYVSTGMHHNKFGVPTPEARVLAERAHASAHLRLVGIDCHIGSQLLDIGPFVDALDRVLELIASLRSNGLAIEHLDIGGGLGIPYDQEAPPTPAQYGTAITKRLANSGLRLVLEPGRVIAGNAGILLTRVLYRKQTPTKRFVIVDAGMNDALRPALYGAFHAIQPVIQTPSRPSARVDVVGPVCETGDFLGRDRVLVWPPPDALLALMSAGAYGFSMASQYNGRPRPAEVLVDGSHTSLIRERETHADLIRGEHRATAKAPDEAPQADEDPSS